MKYKIGIILFSLIISLSLVSNANASITSISQIGTTQTFNLISDSQMDIGLFRADGAVVDGGTVSANDTINLSNYSSNTFDSYVIFFNATCTPRYYTYNKDTALASNCAEGYFTGTKTGTTTFTNFSGYISLLTPPAPTGFTNTAVAGIMTDKLEEFGLKLLAFLGVLIGFMIAYFLFKWAWKRIKSTVK